MNDSKQSEAKPKPTPAAPQATTAPPAKPPLHPAATGKPEGPKVAAAKELGGPAGPEPTRYGDWEIKGRCIDF